MVEQHKAEHYCEVVSIFLVNKNLKCFDLHLFGILHNEMPLESGIHYVSSKSVLTDISWYLSNRTGPTIFIST